METQTLNAKDGTILKTIIRKAGIKEAKSKPHEIGRILIAVVILCLVFISIKNDSCDIKDDITLDDMEDVIKIGTPMYDSIKVMDPDTQRKYLKSIKKAMDDHDDETIARKYIKAILIGLTAAIVSEYIVNGNLNKPISAIGKTVVYSILATMIAINVSS